MIEFSENGPRPEKSPHEEFSTAFYSLLKNKLQEIFPNKSFSSGYLCNGSKKVSRITFSPSDGGPLSASDWQLIKEHACDMYAETMTSEHHDDEVNTENTSITFSDADPDYNDDQTIIITRLDN